MSTTSSESMRSLVAGPMPGARDDLAELVAFRSVADPAQYPPEECERAAQWVIDAFTEVGLQDVTASPTPDGSKAVHGHRPGPEGSPTVLLYCHYDVQPPLGEEAFGAPLATEGQGGSIPLCNVLAEALCLERYAATAGV